MPFKPNYRLQSDEERNKYLNQLYGGSPPSMDYYSQLGAQRRARLDAQRQHEEDDKGSAMQELIDELGGVNPATAPAIPKAENWGSSVTDKATPIKDATRGTGFLGTLGGMGSAIGTGLNEGVRFISEGGLNPFSEAGKQASSNLYERGQQHAEYNRGMQDLLNLTHSAVGGATFDILGDEKYRKGGVVGTIGEMGGSMLPMAGIMGALRPTRLGANFGKNATAGTKALQRAKEGAIAGNIYGGLDAVSTEIQDPDKYTLGEHARNIALETAFGGVIDPVFGGILDAIPAAGRALRNRNTGSNIEESLPVQQQQQQPTIDMPRAEPTTPFDLDTMQSRLQGERFTDRGISSSKQYLDDIINYSDSERQLRRIDETLDPRVRDFDNATSRQIEDARVEQARLQKDYEDMRQEFIKAGRDPYSINEKEIADAHAEWETVKDTRKRYKELTSQFSRFRIPDLYKEEYGGIVPKHLIRTKSNSDIFDAAAEAGYPPGHEGALQFAHDLRSGVDANKTLKRDLVPEQTGRAVPEEELSQLDNINSQTFPETEEAQALQRVIDAYDTQIQQLQNRQYSSTEEYQAAQQVIQPLVQQLDELEARLRRMTSNQRPNNILTAVGIEQPRTTLELPEMPRNTPGGGNTPPMEGTRVAEDGTGYSAETMDGADADMTTFDRGDGGLEVNSNIDTKSELATRFTDDFEPIRFTEQAIDMETTMFEQMHLTRGASGAFEQVSKRQLEPAVAELERVGKLVEGNQYVLDNHLLRIKELERDAAFEPIARLNSKHGFAEDSLDLANVKKMNGKETTEFRNAVKEYKAILNGGGYQVPGGKSIEGMRQNVARYQNDPDIQNYADEIRNYQRGILDYLEDAGVLAREAKEKLIADYPDYIPLVRSVDKSKKGGKNNLLDDIFADYDKLNTGNVRKAIMELSEHGSEQLVRNPIENLAQYGLNAYHAGFNNRAMNELVKMDGAKLNGKYVAKRVNPKTAKKYPKDNIVQFFEEGKSVNFYVNDDILRALNNNKGVAQFDEVAGLLHGLAKIQRQSITANPLFSIKQLSRDIPQAWVVGDFNLLTDLVPAFLDSITRGRALGSKSMLSKFYEHGGGMSNVVSFDRSQFTALQRASKKLNNRGIVELSKDEAVGFTKKWFDRIRLFNESLENAPKLAQFMATARRTGDLDHAAFKGIDIMNFSRSGESVRNANRYVAFINATIQGRSKQFRAMKDPSTWYKTAIVGAVPSIAAYVATQTFASEQQKQIINESPEWQRQTYWLVPSPFNDTNVVRIPKPYEVAALVSTPLEFFLNNEDKVGTEPAEALKEWFAQAVFVDPSLNPATPIYELGTGQDLFTGQSIVPRGEEQLPANEQYDVRTNPLARLAGQIPGVSPRKAEHLIEGFSPVLTETAGDIIGQGLDSTGLNSNPAPAGTRKFPLLDDFRIRGDNYQANTLIGQAHDAQREVQGMRTQTMDEGQLFPYNNAYRAMNQTTQRDSEFASQIRMIDNDPNLSAEEKTSRRREIMEQRNMNARSANEMGMTNTDESNLAQLEQRWSGLGVENTKTEYERTIIAQLVQNGIPEIDANTLMDRAREMKLTEEETVELIRNYLQGR